MIVSSFGKGGERLAPAPSSGGIIDAGLPALSDRCHKSVACHGPSSVRNLCEEDGRRWRMKATTKTRFATLSHEGGLYVEMENCCGSRRRFRRGRSHLGLRAAEPGTRVLRVTRLHGAAGKARCAGGAFREPDSGDLRTAWNHQCGVLDSAAKRP